MSVKISATTKSRKEKLEAIMALTGKDMYGAMDDVLEIMRRISHDMVIPHSFVYTLRSGKSIFMSKRRRNYLLKLAQNQESEGVDFYYNIKADELLDLLMIYIREEILENTHNVTMSHFHEWENLWDE